MDAVLNSIDALSLDTAKRDRSNTRVYIVPLKNKSSYKSPGEHMRVVFQLTEISQSFSQI